MSESGVMDMREAFEAWVEDSGVELNLYRIEGCEGYYHNETRLAFRAYCAGKSSLSRIGDGSKAEPVFEVQHGPLSDNDGEPEWVKIVSLQEWDERNLPHGTKLYFHPAPTAQGSKVPGEPTQKMLNAARDWSDRKYGKPIGNDAARGCWQAMLSAAPVPEKK